MTPRSPSHCAAHAHFAAQNLQHCHEDTCDNLHPRCDAQKLKKTHARSHGRNFFIVFAMDLGRQDFPEANALMANWFGFRSPARRTALTKFRLKNESKA